MLLIDLDQIANEPTPEQLAKETRRFMTGQVDTIIGDRGFAFVNGQDGQRYFLHATQVAEGVHFDDLTVGQEVEFEVEASDRGPRATKARPLAVSANQGGD